MSKKKEVCISSSSWKHNGKIHAEVADSFTTRFMGLMGRNKESLPSGHGLWILPCNSIHMFFMKFPIDVIFLSKKHRVVNMVRGVKPWTGLEFCISSKAYSTLELPSGDIDLFGIEEGQELKIDA